MERMTLCSGVELTVLKDTRYKTNRISVNFLMPLQKETAAANGMVPLILSRACEKYPDFTQLNQHLAELYGAQVGGGVRKIGEVQVLTLSIGAIHDRFALHGEALSAECAELLISMLFSPVLEGGSFREEDFAQEKRQLLEEMQGEFNDKRSFSAKRCREIMFEGEAYGIGRYGDAADVKALTRERVTQAWREMLAYARVKIVLLGDLETGEISEKFRAAFSKVERGEFLECGTVTGKEKTEPKEIVERFDVAQAKLVMGFRTEIAEPSEKTMAMRFMSALLGGTAHSKLFVNVREKLSLCYYCISQYFRNKGILFIESGIEEKNKEAAQTEILRQLEAIRQGEITEEELSATRLSMENSFRTVTDSQFAMENWYLMQTFDRECLTPEEALLRLREVTKEDLIECAKTVWLDTVYVLAGKEKEEQE